MLSHQSTGYLGIILEEEVAFNKAGVALIMAVALWTIQAEAQGPEVHNVLSEKLAEVGEVVFFLIGAMTIVETVDAHQVRLQPVPFWMESLLIVIHCLSELSASKNVAAKLLE